MPQRSSPLKSASGICRTASSQEVLTAYRWPGNIRQLQSVVNRISVLESVRLVSAEVLASYLPAEGSSRLPVRTGEAGADYMSDRDIIFKILYQLRQDIDRIEERLDGLSPEDIALQPQKRLLKKLLQNNQPRTRKTLNNL